MPVARFLGHRLALAVLLVGCVKPGPLVDIHDEVAGNIERALEDPWARNCAPEELAMAQSNQLFAELEFTQGDPRRAEQHLLIAEENILAALKAAGECRPQDIDHDGIWDEDDRCPTEPEDIDGDKDEDGCPDYDRDGDGIADGVDHCPGEPEDKDGFRDGDGCPDWDNDNDGLVDRLDKCPMQAEDLNGFQDQDGCPEGNADRDMDGIFDSVDKCPDEPENRNQYLDEDGCPDVKPQNVRITQKRIEIDKKIQFETGKARILSGSHEILESVAQVMRDYPQIRVRIEGHTDSQGSEAYNQKLSQQRAASVVRFLSRSGIAASRMESVGFGEGRPVETNATPTGRAANRRVEFHIVDGM